MLIFIVLGSYFYWSDTSRGELCNSNGSDSRLALRGDCTVPTYLPYTK
jgi:hypothetical protein